MRRLKRGRLIKIVVVLLIVVSIAFVLLALLGVLPPELTYPLAGYVKGHPEYCEHEVTDDRRIRLASTPYATSKPTNGHQIDPNNWKNERLSGDFMVFHIIEIPLVDYEVTQDGGATWQIFWRYENQINEWAWCDAWGSLNADNFWVWARSQIAVTHDGGNNWIIHDDFKESNTDRIMTIKQVVFDTPETGQIIFFRPDPTLLTHDGGKTWQPDPNWTAPKE